MPGANFLLNLVELTLHLHGQGPSLLPPGRKEYTLKYLLYAPPPPKVNWPHYLDISFLSLVLDILWKLTNSAVRLEIFSKNISAQSFRSSYIFSSQVEQLYIIPLVPNTLTPF